VPGPGQNPAQQAGLDRFHYWIRALGWHDSKSFRQIAMGAFQVANPRRHFIRCSLLATRYSPAIGHDPAAPQPPQPPGGRDGPCVGAAWAENTLNSRCTGWWPHWGHTTRLAAASERTNSSNLA